MFEAATVAVVTPRTTVTLLLNFERLNRLTAYFFVLPGWDVAVRCGSSVTADI